MRNKRIILPLIILVLSISCASNREEPVTMQCTDGYILLDDIETIRTVLHDRGLDTINFRKGENIADIGASAGYFEGMLSIFHDSMTFYIQDIDSSVCNQREVNEVIEFYEAVKNAPITNKFITVTGTDTETNLPDNTFDKIIMMWTYPYLKEPHKFISDIKKKLKEDGVFYVINPDMDFHYAKLIREEYGWNGSTIEKQISDIIACGFELTTISRNHDDPEQPYIMLFKKKL